MSKAKSIMGPCCSISLTYTLVESSKTYTTNDKDCLVVTGLDLANLDSLLPDLLSLLVLQEELALVVHELLDGSLVYWGFIAFRRSTDDLKVFGEGVVRVGSLGEVPTDRLSCQYTARGKLRRLSKKKPTRPSRVLSADERMNRMEPLDIVDVCSG